jgi:hypothetical protein
VARARTLLTGRDRCKWTTIAAASLEPRYDAHVAISEVVEVGEWTELGEVRRPTPSAPIYAHRLVCEWEHGPIPRDWTVDHECGLKRCLDHMAQVTRPENSERERERERGERPTGHPKLIQQHLSRSRRAVPTMGQFPRMNSTTPGPGHAQSVKPPRPTTTRSPLVDRFSDGRDSGYV